VWFLGLDPSERTLVASRFGLGRRRPTLAPTEP